MQSWRVSHDTQLTYAIWERVLALRWGTTKPSCRLSMPPTLPVADMRAISTMRHCVELAKRHKTEIGAHVSQTTGFGRRNMDLRDWELVDLMLYQIGALDGIARAYGSRVTFVKPHGALYHAMLADPGIMNDIMRAVSAGTRTSNWWCWRPRETVRRSNSLWSMS